MMTAGKPPDDAECHQCQNGKARPFVNIHAPHIDGYDAGDDRRRKPPVKQAQRQIPDDQPVFLLRIIPFRCHAELSSSSTAAGQARGVIRNR